MNNQYKITSDTLAIISIGYSRAHILEKKDEFIINKSAYEVINDNCVRYGSSYEGRKDGARYLTGAYSKPPILVEEESNTVLFPTKSPKSLGCIWINLDNVEKIEKNNELVKIVFKNDSFMNVNVSYYSIEKQYLKATLLQSASNRLKNNKNNH